MISANILHLGSCNCY